jgi:DNA invertase Pin-like site-specific DNA recombinase
VSTLITKDLSRLGRNYLETGTYIEVFFPNHNVRYIAINDGVDSIDNAQMDITPFRNIINATLS